MPSGEQQRHKNPKSRLISGFAGSDSVENTNVRGGGWLLSFEQDYHHRASDKHYRVDVFTALPEGDGPEAPPVADEAREPPRQMERAILKLLEERYRAKHRGSCRVRQNHKCKNT